MSNTTVYLDYAAATPVDKAVLAAMQPYLADNFYNPSASYLSAKAVRSDVEAARQTVAGILGAKPGEIVFTAGGTEANNLAISGIMSQYPEANVVVSSIEHESVLEPTRQYNCHEAPVKPDGLIDLLALEKVIDDKTVLVSVLYANNEIGTIQPIKQIAQMVERLRQARKKAGNTLPLYLHTDACQAANYLDLHVHRLGVDLVTLNGGKIYGPKQSGALFVKSGVSIKPLILGGGQERGMRSGTENVAAIIGFAKALELVQNMRRAESERLGKLQSDFIRQLQEKIPAAIINGSLKHRLPNNVHVTLPGHDNEELMMQLDEAGIMCATGSACSASSDEPSHVLAAIGLSQSDIQASLRFTMGQQTTTNDIAYVVKTLHKVLANG